MEEFIATLKSFGMTEYEARAYLTLLRLDVCTAEDISQAGSIPLPRVYDTISELQKKGFVLVTKARPKKFKAVEIDKALNNFLDIRKKEFDGSLSEMKDRIKSSIKILSGIEKVKMKEEKHDIWTTDKRRNISKIVEEQLAEAKKEILSFSGDMSWLNERSDVIKNTLKRGVTMKVVMFPPKTKQMITNIETARKMGIKVRIGNDRPLRGHIIDGKIATIIIKTTSKGNYNTPHTGVPSAEPQSRYELMIFTNPVMVQAFKDNFENLWKRSRD
jgi:sugar-specific transcriptional regulator TrmB